VGTSPNHRRRGRALALLREGLRRLQALGATEAYVDTGQAVPANQLYEAYQGHMWCKWLPPFRRVVPPQV